MEHGAESFEDGKPYGRHGMSPGSRWCFSARREYDIE